jgi:hypothetical protein
MKHFLLEQEGRTITSGDLLCVCFELSSAEMRHGDLAAILETEGGSTHVFDPSSA